LNAFDWINALGARKMSNIGFRKRVSRHGRIVSRHHFAAVIAQLVASSTRLTIVVVLHLLSLCGEGRTRHNTPGGTLSSADMSNASLGLVNGLGFVCHFFILLFASIELVLTDTNVLLHLGPAEMSNVA
jgi:hypothetical protein